MPNLCRTLLAVTVVLAVGGACTSPPVGPSAAPRASSSADVGAPSGGSASADASAAIRPTPLPGCASLEAPPNEGRTHLPDGKTTTYGTYPPTSGPHSITPAAPGWYEEMPPVEQLVHSLEHGFVVVYRAGLDAADETALRARFDGLVAEGFGGLISVPDESIRDPMTLTAWDRLQRCVRADPDAFEGFVREHYAQAPEATVACGFEGAAELPVCESVLAGPSAGPTRPPTAADDALLANIPEDLRAACHPATAFAAGADAGWDCFGKDGGIAFGYSGFPTQAARDTFFEGIVTALQAGTTGDCAAGDAVVRDFSRKDGTTGRLACSTSGSTRALYWSVDGTTDLGIALALDEGVLQAFFETAGPHPSSP